MKETKYRKTAHLMVRPVKKSQVHKEVNNYTKIHNCLSCTRSFSAKSRFNKICDMCKLSDKWRGW
jgi:hypothetical protein